MPSPPTLEPEPPVSAALAGPALLAGVVMVCVYAAAGAMLGAVAVTLSPGPETAGGAWDFGVWLISVGLAAASVRPVLRRTARRSAVGALAGLVLALSYGGLAVLLDATGARDPMLAVELLVMVAAGALAGVRTGSPPPRSAEPEAAVGPDD